MAGFQELMQVSKAFEEDLRRGALDLYSAKRNETFEEKLSKKMEELILFTSKFSLLATKPLALNSEIVELSKASVYKEYGDTVSQKVFEQQYVKSLLQNKFTKKYKADSNVDDRKKEIIDQWKEYTDKDTRIRELMEVLEKKEEEYLDVKEQLDKELGELYEMKKKAATETEGVEGNMENKEQAQLFKKLNKLVQKLQLMQWLMNALVTSRNNSYDWLADPKKLFQTVKMSRHKTTIENLFEEP